MAKKSKADWADNYGARTPAGFVSEVAGSVRQKVTFVPGFGMGNVLYDGGSVTFTLADVQDFEVIETSRQRFRRA